MSWERKDLGDLVSDLNQRCAALDWLLVYVPLTWDANLQIRKIIDSMQRAASCLTKLYNEQEEYEPKDSGTLEV